MSQPLNPTLFRLLELQFGRVDIVSQGQSLVWSEASRRAETTRHGEADLHRKVISSGEEYKVNCPFCSDTRQRLYINHRWGVLDEESRRLNLFLCQCFNEQCMDSRDRQIQLHDRVFSPANPSHQKGKMAVAAGRRASNKVGEVAPPGPTIPIHELAKRHPFHRAVEFLESRCYDIEKLGRIYKVGYCAQSRFSLAQDRIIIPVHQDGKLVGWQARYIGDPPTKRVPKYWSCPHMVRRLLAYNFETATRYRTIVIVEGPGDVWSFGAQSMGLFGKTMSRELQKQLYSKIIHKKRGQPKRRQDSSVVVMLDPEQDPKEKAKGKPHHIEKLVEDLKNEGMTRNVLPVYLPLGMDPGSSDRQWMFQRIREQADEQKIPVYFGKKALWRNVT